MEKKILKRDAFPPFLKQIPSPPERLYFIGTLPNPNDYIYLAVVGTRRYSSYGKEACERIIGGLKGYKIAIVSGLALGIDSIAHRAAMENGLPTIAIPGSGLDEKVLHPHSHKKLAREIVEKGGALLSEFEWGMPAGLHTFPQRNRIIAGISRGVVIIEAPEKSGALITANFALEFNREIMAVPGPIFNENSKGTNRLIKEGAAPITSAEDILEIFNLPKKGENLQLELENLSPLEIEILKNLDEPLSKDELILKLKKPSAEINPILMSMQLNGIIREIDGRIYKRDV